MSSRGRVRRFLQEASFVVGPMAWTVTMVVNVLWVRVVAGFTFMACLWALEPRRRRDV